MQNYHKIWTVYKRILSDIKTKGIEVAPRWLKVMECINYYFTIKDVTRVIINVIWIKEFSYKYVYTELLWYLSGSLKIDFIWQFAKLWTRIQDENWNINSNYWYLALYNESANWFTQYWRALKSLILDKNSRQSIIRYNSNEHQVSWTKDFTCFPPWTIIHSPEWNITIGRLYRKFKEWKIKEYPVYSFNEKTLQTEIKMCTNAFYNWKWRLINIILDNNTSFMCTPEHLILTRYKNKRIRKEAKDLCSDDVIQKITYIWDKEIMKNNNVWTQYENRVYIHREYYKFLHKDEDISNKEIHHININKYDNRKCNLLSCTKEQHRAIHQVNNNSNNKIHNYNENSLQIRINNYKSSDYFDKTRNEKNMFNKVKKIEKVSRNTHDLYDIEVEDNHNFFINSWVCVHNCTLTNQFFIRNNKLIGIVNMRSNDVFYGLTYDIVWFSLVMQSLYIDLIKYYPELELGEMHYNAASMHYYEDFYERVNNILKCSIIKTRQLRLTKSLHQIKNSINIKKLQEQAIRNKNKGNSFFRLKLLRLLWLFNK